MKSKKSRIGELIIKEHYPLEKHYRLFKPITLEEHHPPVIRGYGSYDGGMKDYDSWDEVVDVWTPETRIFVRLPLLEIDVKKVITGKKPYLVVTEYFVEKKDPPFGYGQSDDWCFYKFTNVEEEIALKIVKKLISLEIKEECFNVGLELIINQTERKARIKAKADAVKTEIEEKAKKYFNRTR